MKKHYIIPEKDLLTLLNEERELKALENAGVDNWEGYHLRYECLDEEEYPEWTAESISDLYKSIEYSEYIYATEEEKIAGSIILNPEHKCQANFQSEIVDELKTMNRLLSFILINNSNPVLDSTYNIPFNQKSLELWEEYANKIYTLIKDGKITRHGEQ